MATLLIHNARIITGTREFTGFLAVNPPFIDAIGEGEPSADMLTAYDDVIDAGGKYLLPGAIDDQVHFREPGLTH